MMITHYDKLYLKTEHVRNELEHEFRIQYGLEIPTYPMQNYKSSGCMSLTSNQLLSYFA